MVDGSSRQLTKKKGGIDELLSVVEFERDFFLIPLILSCQREWQDPRSQVVN
jgi:hypothetical protein